MTPSEYYEQELRKRQERWDEDTFLPALFEAVQLCQIWQIPLPQWAALASLNLIIDAYNESSSGSPEGGAHGSLGGRTRMDYAHWLRWKSVRFVLKQHGMDALPSSARGRRKYGAISRRAIFEKAAERLEGNRLAKPGRWETIEESFTIVQTSLDRDEQRFRFDNLHTFG